MLKKLNRKRRIALAPASVRLENGTEVQIDGIDKSRRVLCEVYAHIGTMKGSQPDKVATDMLKLILVEPKHGRRWRKILCFADKEAMSRFSGKSWLAEAVQMFHFELELATLPRKARIKVARAQRRQTMVNR
jgi:hypothetical protein